MVKNRLVAECHPGASGRFLLWAPLFLSLHFNRPANWPPDYQNGS